MKSAGDLRRLQELAVRGGPRDHEIAVLREIHERAGRGVAGGAHAAESVWGASSVPRDGE
jgi:hypothetical protein